MKLDFNKVIEWFQKAGVQQTEPYRQAYINYIEEEFNEFIDAVLAGNKIEELDAICDLIWVSAGYLYAGKKMVLKEITHCGWLTTITQRVAFLQLHDIVYTIIVDDVIAHNKIGISLINWLIKFAELRGYNLEGAFNEVMRSNYTKLIEPIYNESGKLGKNPKHYSAPDLADYV